MKIATWNVNSVRARLVHVLDWLGHEQPDVLALQETKLEDHLFPLLDFEALGYRVVASGQKSYNGVALVSRETPVDVVRDLPASDDPSRRLLAATVAGIRIVNLYAPNGQSVGSPKYEQKLLWYARLCEWMAGEISAHSRLLVVGDLNVAPEPRDVHDPVRWEGRILCSGPEREAFQELLRVGLVDVFRAFEPASGHYTWWDYRAGSFRRNLGLRIDHVLATPELARLCVACTIDRTPRGRDKPSDHTPVIAEIEA